MMASGGTFQILMFVFSMCGPAGTYDGKPYYGGTNERPCKEYAYSGDCMKAAEAVHGICIIRGATKLESLH